MSELKPCPFCGSNGLITEGFRGAYENRDRIAYLTCSRCEAQGEKFSGIDCREKAIEAWNRRIK